MNIIFMGTPVFAVPCLDALIKAGHTVQCVFCQPDKPKNRGQKLQMPAVKEFALEQGIPVYQPCSLRTGADGEQAHQVIQENQPDCIVVVAYGQILPKDILDLPKYGCINVHASLLPRYRGASPINYCIMKGETETGVSIMYMSEGLDAGDVILQERVTIPEDQIASDLHDELQALGAKLLMQVMPLLAAGAAQRTPQNDADSCYAPMITKQMCRIDWTQPAKQIYNQIRGLAETPAAYTFYNDKRLKIYRTAVDVPGESIVGLQPGAIIEPDALSVLCGDGNMLRLLEIQLEGNKRMEADAFLRGRKPEMGMTLR